MVQKFDVIVLGAGASGLMAALRAGARGKSVAVIDHAQQVGAKILISGGGRCNFTNLHCGKESYISQNPSFCLSALSAFPPQAFLNMLRKHAIGYHEKKLGQLFCDSSARAIVDMLVAECQAAQVEFHMGQNIVSVQRNEDFTITTSSTSYHADSLIVATGGLACPKIGASGFAHQIAEQFGHAIIKPRPALVPLVFEDHALSFMNALSGISLRARISCEKRAFTDDLIFTHRGLSGPALLQISSYWEEGKSLSVDFLPDTDLAAFLKDAKKTRPKAEVRTVLASLLPQRLAHALCVQQNITSTMADVSHKTLEALALSVKAWKVMPATTEGFSKAEVTNGGIDTQDLSSKNMQSTKVPRLFFTGEAIDVTGWLGGYNLQWAWSSGWTAGSNA